MTAPEASPVQSGLSGTGVVETPLGRIRSPRSRAGRLLNQLSSGEDTALPRGGHCCGASGARNHAGRNPRGARTVGSVRGIRSLPLCAHAAGCRKLSRPFRRRRIGGTVFRVCLVKVQHFKGGERTGQEQGEEEDQMRHLRASSLLPGTPHELPPFRGRCPALQGAAGSSVVMKTGSGRRYSLNVGLNQADFKGIVENPSSPLGWESGS
jgi:hypothetical protein